MTRFHYVFPTVPQNWCDLHHCATFSNPIAYDNAKSIPPVGIALYSFLFIYFVVLTLVFFRIGGLL